MKRVKIAKKSSQPKRHPDKIAQLVKIYGKETGTTDIKTVSKELKDMGFPSLAKILAGK